MNSKAFVAILVGTVLTLAAWAWAQQGAAPQQPPTGSAGQGMIGQQGGSGGMMGGGMMGPGGMMGGYGPYSGYGQRQFSSNGEQIYLTGVSREDGYIPRVGGPPWAQRVGCVACHGPNGRGGYPVMMGTEIPPDIRYKTLTSAESHEEGEKKEEMDHPPYTDATIKRAITQGVDPAGKPLDWTMPRWQMTKQELQDVTSFLKTLQ